MPLDPRPKTFPQKLQTLKRALGARGYDPRDFDVEADHSSPLASLFALAGGLLIVRRRSTGEERAYATDTESAWLDSVMLDLDHGYLGDGDSRPAQLSLLPHEDAQRSLAQPNG